MSRLIPSLYIEKFEMANLLLEMWVMIIIPTELILGFCSITYYSPSKKPRLHQNFLLLFTERPWLVFCFCVFAIWFMSSFGVGCSCLLCLFVVFFFVCLEFQIIRFVISTLTPKFFIEMSFCFLLPYFVSKILFVLLRQEAAEETQEDGREVEQMEQEEEEEEKGVGGGGEWRLAWVLFVLLLSTLVCYQPTELISASFFFLFLFQKLSNFSPHFPVYPPPHPRP